MTAPARPAPVVRYLRRPLWWAAAAGFLVAVALAAAVPEVRQERSTFADARVMEVDASPIDPDTGLIDVTFTDPDTGRTVRAAVLHRSYAEPKDGRVSVEVSRSDPQAVRLADEHRGYFDDLAFYAAGVLLPLAAWAFRRLHFRGLERLALSPGTTFAMLGALTPPDLLHRRWRLSLYPLNAEPGAESVCTVELIWLPVRPAGAFAVDVKGEPRPFGTIAVRVGDELFWPRGRGLATRSQPGLPSAVVAIPPPIATLPAPEPRPSLWGSRALRLVGVLALGTFVWMATASSWQSEQILERSLPALGTVVGDGRGLASVVEFHDGDAVAQATVTFSTGRPSDGSQVPIRYDTTDPSTAWSATDAGPGLTLVDLGAVASLFAASTAFLAGAIARRGELERLGRYELVTTGRVSLGSYPT